MNKTEYIEKVQELQRLPYNWDFEGADPPNENAAKNAIDFIHWALENDLEISDIDADVLGGIAIWIGDNIWVSCLNYREPSVVIINDQMNISGPLKDLKDEVKRFIGGFYDKK